MHIFGILCVRVKISVRLNLSVFRSCFRTASGHSVSDFCIGLNISSRSF